MDDAIKSTHAFSCKRDMISKSYTVHWHFFSNYPLFHSPVKEKGKLWRIKELTKAQWINVNQNNRFYIVRKNWPYRPTTSGSYGRHGGMQASRRNVGGFQNFWILYRLKYSGFYYHSNVITVLELQFSLLLSTKAYFKVYLKCKKFGSNFSCQSLLLLHTMLSHYINLV